LGGVAAAGAVIAAVGTVVALLVAFVQISSARSDRRHDELARLARDRMDQAQHISAWIGTPSGTPVRTAPGPAMRTLTTLRNSSRQPVYRVVVWLVFVQGGVPHTGEEMRQVDPDAVRLLDPVPPGTFVVSLRGDWGGMYRHPGVEVAFTDAVGAHWIRRGNGALEEIADDPLDRYDISQPVDWEVPAPA
jgi:hypothetical protein